MDNLRITVEFGGGAELLFGNKKNYVINLPGSAWNIEALLHWMTEHLLKERPELFIQNKSVRPGILVLVNDADWELLVHKDYTGWANYLAHHVDLAYYHIYRAVQLQDKVVHILGSTKHPFTNSVYKLV